MDENGDVVKRINYDDYGKPINPALLSDMRTQVGFQGRLWDSQAKLYDFRTRHYDPAIGRFLQRDSIGTWGDPLNMGNAYSFVGNAPWVYRDPYGLWAAGDLADDLDDLFDTTPVSTGSFVGDLGMYGAQGAARMAADTLRFGQGAAHAYEGYDANGNKLSPAERALSGINDLGRGASLAGGIGGVVGKLKPAACSMDFGFLPEHVALSFRSATYSTKVTEEATLLYRVWGGKAGELGSYWTRTRPNGPLQARMDLALRPEWGNTAEKVSTIVVPKGTVIHEGYAAPQGNLLGGGSQIYIPEVDPSWLF